MHSSRQSSARALALVALLACSPDNADTNATHASSSPREQLGCTQTAGERPDTSRAIGDTAATSAWRRRWAKGVEYRCVVNDSLPPFRILAIGDGVWSMDSLRIISSTAGAAATQSIPLGADFEPPSPDEQRFLQVQDLDADGYADLLVGKSWGATGNTDYALWMFDPSSRRFVTDTSLATVPFTHVVAGQPCIWTSWNTSAFDDCRAMYCRRAARWVVDSTIEHALDRAKRQLITTFTARRHDSLVVTSRKVERDTT
ncbi:MAG: hypothetical protein JWO05_1021 [Gemmatimonadetes bacterium]|nr:hypothetical protein [Gemmatimonadota bacterium]